MTIDERNALRAASGLPLLDREREAERAKGANNQVEFERRVTHSGGGKISRNVPLASVDFRLCGAAGKKDQLVVAIGEERF